MVGGYELFPVCKILENQIWFRRRTMNDIANGIMEYIQPKDRPSVFEARIIDYHTGDRKLTVTAPVENGCLVLKLKMNKLNREFEVNYDASNLRGAVSLAKTFCGARDVLELVYRGDTGDDEICISEDRFNYNDDPVASVLTEALSILLTK